MPSSHYIHLFNWDAAAVARKSFGDEIFDPFVEIDSVIEEQEYGGILFLSKIELALDPIINNALRDFGFLGASSWFDLIAQELLKDCDVKGLALARTALMPFLGPRYYFCDLHPPPACAYVPTILSPEHAESIYRTLEDVDLKEISTFDLHCVTQRINPELQPRENPYFRYVSDLSRYLEMYKDLFRQAMRDRAGIISYFD